MFLLQEFLKAINIYCLHCNVHEKHEKEYCVSGVYLAVVCLCVIPVLLWHARLAVMPRACRTEEDFHCKGQRPRPRGFNNTNCSGGKVRSRMSSRIK